MTLKASHVRISVDPDSSAGGATPPPLPTPHAANGTAQQQQQSGHAGGRPRPENERRTPKSTLCLHTRQPAATADGDDDDDKVDALAAKARLSPAPVTDKDHRGSTNSTAINSTTTTANGADDRYDEEEAERAEVLHRLAAAQRWVNASRQRFAPAYSPFEHVLGVANPLSGERGSVQAVVRGMRASLGPDRLVQLSTAIFADPAEMRGAIKHQTFIFHDPPSNPPPRFARVAARSGRGSAPVPTSTAAAAAASPSSGGRYVDVDESRVSSIRRGITGRRRRKVTFSLGTTSADAAAGSDGWSEVEMAVAPATTGSGGSSSGRSKAANRPVEGEAGGSDEAVDDSGLTRGTVVVAGGDGTVSFMMGQLLLTREAVEAELRLILRPGVPLRGDGTTGNRRSGANPSIRTGDGGVAAGPHPALSLHGYAYLLNPRRYFTPSAIAPIAMGTGNDYSNCVGFGSGFTQYRGSGLCCCCDRDVDDLLTRLVTAPSVPFDRWTADFVPLRVAQENLRPLAKEDEEEEHDREEVKATPPPLGIVAVRPRPPNNVANAVHQVDWARASEQPGCVSHTMTNYLSVGYDAYVAKQFGETRRNYPALCNSRIQNKAMYTLLGMTGNVQCKSIRSLIPMVCVPLAQPTIGTTTPSKASPQQQQRGMMALQLPSRAKALVLSNVSRYGSGTQPWKIEEGEIYYRPVDMIFREEDGGNSSNSGSPGSAGASASFHHRRFPSSPMDVSATSASGGHVPRPPLFPDSGGDNGSGDSPGLPNNNSSISGTSFGNASMLTAAAAGEVVGSIVPASCAAAPPPPAPTAVAIDDRKFELQAMGGFLSYGALGLGLRGAVKMAQTAEVFVFVLCTPDDLRYERGGGLSSPFSKRRMSKYEEGLTTDPRVKASLNVQVDGETVPRISEPTIVHVRPAARDRVYVRCRNPDVVSHTRAGVATATNTAK